MKKSATIIQENTVKKTVKESAGNTRHQAREQRLSYYRRRLIAFMADCHPRYFEQNNLTPEAWEEFLTARIEAAEAEDVRYTRKGFPIHLVDKYAMEVLLSNLLFSRYQVVLHILDTFYPNIRQNLNLDAIYAIEDSCADVFDKYKIRDDYVLDPLYDNLIGDLQPCVHQYLMDNL